MSASFLSETELPGRVINADTRSIIAHRYYWASGFVFGKETLEVGCGPGLGLGWLARHARRVIGGDIVEDNLRLAKQHYGARIFLTRMDAHRFPFKDHSLDAIVCVAAIIYMDAAALFGECQRVLHRDGTLLINTPNKNQPRFRPTRLSREYHSPPELFALLHQNGFDCKMFGAFGVSALEAETRPSFWGRLSLRTRALAGRILRKAGVYGPVKKALGIQSSGISLGAELGDEDMRLVRDIPLVPISSAVPDSDYRIIYAVAKAI